MNRQRCFVFFLFLLIFTSSYGAKNGAEFEIIGIKGDVKENVAARLDSIFKNKILSNLNNEMKKQRLATEIEEAVKPFGYFSPKISTNLKSKKVLINIQLGQAVTVKSIQIVVNGEGKNNNEINHYIRAFPIKKDSILISPDYEKAKEKLLNIANQQGFIKARYSTSKIMVNERSHEAFIVINLNTGRRFYYGNFNIANTPYSDSFIRKMIRIKENDPFSSDALLSMQQDLLSSPFFNKVLAIPDMNNIENSQVPVNFILDVPKPKIYSFGIGYGTVTGPRFSANMKLQQLNENGNYLEAQLKLSTVLSGLGAKYHIPGQNPLTDEWVLGVDSEIFNPKNGHSKSITAQVGETRKYNYIEAKYFLNYLIERYEIENEAKRSSRLLYPELILEYLNVDDRIHTSEGLLVHFQLRGAAKPLLSSTSFLQGLINAKYLLSPTDLSKVILRGSFGATAVQNSKHLPLSMFFFAGGTNSIRGYKDSSLGPGKYLELGSLEVRHSIKGPWVGAFFIDAGNALDHLKGKIYKSVGVGVIYDSLIGPIKIYAAHPLNRGQKSFGIEFSLGPEF